jgi:LEA14-like dessication related protein
VYLNRFKPGMCGLVSLLFLLTSCGNFEELSMVGDPEVKFKGIKENQIEYQLIVEIDNPNAQSFNVKKATFDVSIKDKAVGKTKLTEPVKITGKSSEVYTFNMVGTIDDKSESLGIMLGSVFERRIKLTIEGKIKATSFGMISQTFPVEWEESTSF